METTCASEIEAGEVLKELERILSDKRFAGSERATRFLRYVVEKTLLGEGSEIKEIVIATDLYQRSSEYDPKIDSTVRVEATRLRTKLNSYYREGGRHDPVTITIPKGSYVPQFERRSLDQLPIDTEVVSVTQGSAPFPPTTNCERVRGRRITVISAALLATAAVCLVGQAAIARRTAPEARAAWEEGTALLAQDPHTGGSEHGAPQMLLQAIDRFEYAVKQEPAFAQGWASLAEAYEYASPYVGRNGADDAARAEAAARRAIVLDSGLAAAHANLATVLFYLRWDFRGAEAEYRRALTLNRNLPHATVELADLLRETGRLKDAEDLVKSARDSMPAQPVLAWKQAEIELDCNKTQDAIATATSAIRLKRDYGRAYVVLGMAYEAEGRVEDAAEQYRRAQALDNQDRRALPALGYLLGQTGKESEAKQLLDRLIRINAEVRNCAFQVAVVYEGLGDHERALNWLGTAYRTHQMHVPFMVVEPRFAGLRSALKFQELLRRTGLEKRF